MTTPEGFVTGDAKCGVPAPNMASVCALPKGHQGDHRNVWNSAWSPLGKVAGQPVVLEFTVNAGPGFPTVSRLFGHIDPGSVRTSAQAKATPGWRVGTKQPRNLYRDDVYMGVMFDDRVSREVAEAMNASRELDDARAAGEAYRRQAQNLKIERNNAYDKLSELRDQLSDAKSKNANLAAANQDLRSIRAQDAARIERLSGCLADAEAAAGWREQCRIRTTRAPTELLLHTCRRAAGHTGKHNSGVAAGEGREW